MLCGNPYLYLGTRSSHLSATRSSWRVCLVVFPLEERVKVLVESLAIYLVSQAKNVSLQSIGLLLLALTRVFYKVESPPKDDDVDDEDDKVDVALEAS